MSLLLYDRRSLTRDGTTHYLTGALDANPVFRTPSLALQLAPTPGFNRYAGWAIPSCMGQQQAEGILA